MLKQLEGSHAVAEAVALYRERFPRLFEAEGPDIGPDNYRAAIDLALAMQESGEPQAADRLLEAAAAFIESRPRLGLGSGYGISDVQILALQGEPEAALRNFTDLILFILTLISFHVSYFLR